MDLNQIYEHVVAGDPAKVKELTQQALAEGAAPIEIIGGFLMHLNKYKARV
jgi:methanogenic corrinoid protein MtbC1